MLEACIASVRDGGDADHIIVIDNGSRADLSMDVECIRPTVNLGYGGGANAGFRRAAELGATAIALLNDDVVVERGWLRPLVDALLERSHESARCNPSCCSPAPIRRASTVWVLTSVQTAQGETSATTNWTGPSSPSRVPSLRSRAAPFCSAPSSFEATGGFDDSYFLYYEDVDLARRGAGLGWTYRCVPASRVWHRVSASTARLGDRARYLQERNRLRYAFKFGDRSLVMRGRVAVDPATAMDPRPTHAAGLGCGAGKCSPGAPRTVFLDEIIDFFPRLTSDAAWCHPRG